MPDDGLQGQDVCMESKTTPSSKRKMQRGKRKSNHLKRLKTDNSPAPVYIHSFDNKEALDRGKMWDKIKVDKKLSYVPIENSPNPAAEAALYSECDLGVSCILHGIFADALVQIEELLQEGEKAPEFHVALGTQSMMDDMDGKEVEMEYPTKKRFKWYHRVPV